MKPLFSPLLLVLAACSYEAPAPALPAPTPAAQKTAPVDSAGRRGFDRIPSGALPQGWRIAATRPADAQATWKVVADASAPSPPHALALTAANHSRTDTFNLCWDESSKFHEGVFELAFKANGGTHDQGGGPIWRAQDENNYYVCRANPLESNFRLYVVQNGERKQLASADGPVASGIWHRIRVEHRGAHIVCTLDDQLRLEADDATLSDAGRVGLWTKADALTAFDDLTVRSAR
jgi:hypothetical protein